MILAETNKVRKGINDQIDALERKAYQAGLEEGRRERSESVTDEKSRDRHDYMVEGANALKQALTDLYMFVAEKEPEPHLVITAVMLLEDVENIFDMADRAYETPEAPKSEKAYKPEKGDTVKDPSGRECIVTNTDTHIHVMYDDGKTHKWSKAERFTPIPDADFISFFKE